MLIWFALAIPVLFCAFIAWKYNRNIIWWEFLIPFTISIALILIFKFSTQYALTRDIEYWGGTVEYVEYYEPWNEYIHKICTESYACGTDGNGNTQYCTRTYDCSYVDYHPEHWDAVDNNGIRYGISKQTYTRIKKKFGNSVFVDLDRNYHNIDGDKYQSTWDKSFERFEFAASKHSYKNKVQASSSVFNFPEVTEEEVEQYKLYDYPKIEAWQKLPAILSFKGYKRSKKIDKLYDWLNGKLGKKKEVRVWILLYYNAPRQTGLLQEALWKGGNKNEFNVAISIGKSNNVQWCYPFSWTEVQSLKIDTRTYIEEMEKLDLEKIYKFLYKDIDEKFIRKPFAEFNYLAVSPPTWAIIVTFALTLIANVVCSIWIVNNDIE